MSLTPGQDTFTIDRLRQVWRQGHRVRGSYIRSQAESFLYNSHHNPKHNQNFCLRLHASVQDPTGHFSRIDDAFAPVMVGHFNPTVSEDTVRILIRCGNASILDPFIYSFIRFL